MRNAFDAKPHFSHPTHRLLNDRQRVLSGCALARIDRHVGREHWRALRMSQSLNEFLEESQGLLGWHQPVGQIPCHETPSTSYSQRTLPQARNIAARIFGDKT